MNKKTELRKKYACLRDSIPKRHRLDDAEKICQRLVESEYYKRSKTVFVYVSFGSEVSTDLLIDRIIRDKGLAVVPLCDTETHTMRLIGIENKTQLEPGSYGILEPKRKLLEGGELTEFDKNEIDLAIVPGLAFDDSGLRLGYGGGYYDRFFEGFKGCSIGLSYSESMTESLPETEYDCRIDGVICPGEMKIYGDRLLKN